MNTAPIKDLETLLLRIKETAAENERVSVGHVLDSVGDRSFAPVILIAGVVMSAPLVGDVPGVPVIFGTLVVLTSAQMLLGREHLWLPAWLLARSVSREKLIKTIDRMWKPICYIDRLIKPRLTVLTSGAGVYVIAIACMLISLGTPLMEVVPMSANVAGAALTAFGLALVARDGLFAAIAFTFTAAVFGILGYFIIF